MIDDLAEDYPEAASYIQEAVDEHGEEWVVENYYPRVYQLGVIIDMPEVEELPFYDEEKHDVMSKEERKEMAEALSKYRENLRTDNKPGKD